MTSIYTLTIFTSAFLLFLIQPMISKILLPHLGGSPAVWNTAMMFFQALLLLGYLYTHLSGKWLGVKKQVRLHIALLLLSLLWLPVVVKTQLDFASVDFPVRWVLVSLFLSIGFPFFILAANAPLIQYWLAHTHHPHAKNPYFLYSASNVGSLLALFSYPFAIEPLLKLPQQTNFWSLLFVLLLLCIAACAWLLFKNYKPVAADAHDPAQKAPSATTRMHWVVLAFFPSSLLLGVTTFITTDIASMPLFWVVPLAVYLLTFILAFAQQPLLVDRALNAQLILVPLTVLAIVYKLNYITPILLLHLFAFFAIAMGCHGTLARNKPGTRYLTEYYVWISFGGMLGGIFNSLVAPVVFTEPVEYPLILILSLLARPLLGSYRNPDRERRLDYLLPVLFGVVIWALVYAGNTALAHYATQLKVVNAWVASLASQENKIYFFNATKSVLTCLLYLFIMWAVVKTHKRPVRFTLVILALIIALPLAVGGSSGGDSAKNTPPSSLIYSERNFFGVNRVIDFHPLNARLIMHGTTIHGMQAREGAERLQPISYYGPLREVFRTLPPGLTGKPVAVLGLGAGVQACLGTKGQPFDFYEIDPAVAAIAQNPEYFTYLKDCPAKSRVIMGDGRLALEKAPDGSYGVIIMDAFSSDAIPLHLLTREALAMYRQKLMKNGIIMFNISNRHLVLKDVMATLAADAGMQAITIRNIHLKSKLETRSEWVFISENSALLEAIGHKNPEWKPLKSEKSADAWTDNYSNILQTLF